MSTIDADGVSLFYTEKGSGEPVVFCHGIPTDYRAWSSQLEFLSGHFRAISYSRRYAYPNTRQGDVLDSTIMANAADLANLLRKLDATPVHLVGHSYGGGIAGYLAVNHPDLLRSIALVEPYVPTLLIKDQNSRTQQLSFLLKHPSVAFAAMKALRKAGSSTKALDSGDIETAVRINLSVTQDMDDALEHFSEEQRRMMLDNGKTYREVTTPFPSLTREDLKKVRTPTLVVGGETSNLLLRKMTEITAASIPDCKKVTIAGSGHFPHIEKSAEFNTHLMGFLKP